LTLPPQEWLWVVGYFLRAKLLFAHRSGAAVEDTVTRIHQVSCCYVQTWRDVSPGTKFVSQVLSSHTQALQDSVWGGLPELTNKDGSECSDSCPVQAWSMACLLDVLYDLRQFN